MVAYNALHISVWVFYTFSNTWHKTAVKTRIFYPASAFAMDIFLFASR